jgi:hypothetical protein
LLFGFTKLGDKTPRNPTLSGSAPRFRFFVGSRRQNHLHHSPHAPSAFPSCKHFRISWSCSLVHDALAFVARRSVLRRHRASNGSCDEMCASPTSQSRPPCLSEPGCLPEVRKHARPRRCWGWERPILPHSLDTGPARLTISRRKPGGGASRLRCSPFSRGRFGHVLSPRVIIKVPPSKSKSDHFKAKISLTLRPRHIAITTIVRTGSSSLSQICWNCSGVMIDFFRLGRLDPPLISTRLRGFR